MTKGILLVTAIYLAAVVDSVVAPRLAVGGVVPDFLALAAMLLLSVVRGSGGILIAAVAGGIADLNSAGRCGVGVAAFGAVAFVVCLTRRRTFPRPLVQAAVIFAAVAATSLCIAVLRGLLKEIEWSPAGYLVGGVGAGLYTALLGLPIYCVVCRFAHRQAAAF